ncbi:NAD(P)-dependent oxidoreductase [Nocardia jiangxiensis]|uniref:NAD(P)-dependent oxidoreductase n=1 Tax=Nocardia jiangxiensis TaxID=282685 RepID=A0ABW6SFG8_9NOCA|nr:NAD(P)-dependent oxidoreductase [Nocardia jiangxiensis]
MKIGVVGLGNMGGEIATTLLRAGHEVTVFDIRPEAVERLVSAGAKGAESIASLAGDVDVLSVVVLNEEQVRGVRDEVAAAGRPATLVIHSTVTPGFVQTLAEASKAEKIDIVDATVAGGVARARTGDLTVMVGGEDTVVERLAPLFDAIGREVFHVGPAGAGSAVKLAVNYLTIGSYAIQMEAMEFARSFGLTEDALTAVLVTSNADSRAIRTWGYQDRMRRSAAAGTALPQVVMKKDVTSFAVAGAQNGVLLPLATMAAETLLNKVEVRDRFLDEVGAELPPRCSICSLELAAPYREVGVHPECARS